MTDPALLAYEHNGLRVAPAHFYSIACDPRRSVAVEACAGAGKTWMLVSRIVRALLEGCAPHEILAITFTKKAAGEMRQRLHEWLAEFAQAPAERLQLELQLRGVPASAWHEGQGGPGQAALLQQLQQALFDAGRPVQVRTFHSWFAALLRTAPLAVLDRMGLPAGYELLEDDSEAVAAVWRRFYRALLERPTTRADHDALIAEHGRAQTQKALLAALARRTEFALADGQGVVETSVPHFHALFAQRRPGWLVHQEPSQALDDEATARRWHAWSATLGRESGATAPKAAAAIVDAFLGPPGEPRLEALRRALFVKEADRLSRHLQKFEAAQEAEAELQDLCEARRQHQAWVHQQRMARLTRLLLDEFAALKHERAWVDMNDVERAALVMLSDPVLSGWVQERLDARVRHLLIDEFQDTNPLQWQALHAWLAGYAGAGQAPSVFIVGDPKQSIYRFRRAEPQVFRAAQRFVVEGLGGDRLSCDHTRRNAPEVIDLVNAAMLAAQQAGEYEGYRPHTTDSRQRGATLCLPAIPRPDREGGIEAASAPWRDSLQTPRTTPEETLRSLECQQAALWLSSLLQPGPEGQAGLKPRDIMVLSRRRDRLAVMQQALQALGIPTQQPEKSSLDEAPEVQDLLALVDALVSPQHNLSLARALKSPLFGLPDDDLVRIALLQRQRRSEARGALGGIAPPRAPASWLGLLQATDSLPSDWPPALRGLGAQLSRWQHSLQTLPPHDALDAIYHQGEVLARFAASAPPTRRDVVLGNLRALLAAALQVDGGRYVSAYGFVRALKAGRVPAPARADAAAVRLLTIHGAKGLEAPLVLLLDTDAPPARAESMGMLVDWPGEAAAPLSLVFLASESRPPPCALAALEAERRERLREELNALYVALTRARQQLVISSVTPHRASEGSWWQRLQALCEPVPLELEEDGVPVSRAAAGLPVPEFVLLQLPDAGPAVAAAAATAGMPGAGVRVAGAPADRSGPATGGLSDDRAAALGEAMHRLLEWLPLRAGGLREVDLDQHWTAARQQSLRRDFGLGAGAQAQALDAARRIACGQGAWAWDADQVAWAANEVPLNHGGESLRLDRLVRRRDSGQWWVLDHKSASRPERQVELVQQLRRYAQAVAKAVAVPLSEVRAAFLSATGEWVPLEGLGAEVQGL